MPCCARHRDKMPEHVSLLVITFISTLDLLYLFIFQLQMHICTLPFLPLKEEFPSHSGNVLKLTCRSPGPLRAKPLPLRQLHWKTAAFLLIFSFYSNSTLFIFIRFIFKVLPVVFISSFYYIVSVPCHNL